MKRSEEDWGKDGKAILYTPDSRHPWVDTVQLVENTGEISLMICGHERNDKAVSSQEHKLVEKKMQELLGIKRLYEGGLFQHNPGSEAFEDAMTYDQIDFKAGPTSKIRSVINQANLPADITEAILDDLQKIWARTPP